MHSKVTRIMRVTMRESAQVRACESRHIPLLTALLLCLALLSASCSAAPLEPEPSERPEQARSLEAPGCDALCGRIREELNAFASWLAANEAVGYIGEVGWPDNSEGEATEWNRIGEAWYEAADAAGLPVTAWSTGAWWGDYELAVYRALHGMSQVDTPNTQASVIERHLSSGTVLRGVNVSGAEFGAQSTEATSSFSNANPGVYDRDYHYDSRETFAYLASRGVKIVRIPFRWERIQPALGAPLDEGELSRLQSVVDRAHGAGLQVVLDLHNFAAYYLFDGQQGVRRPLDSPELPPDRLVDVWVRLSTAFQDHPGVLAYSIMNEPTELPSSDGLTPAQLWERTSQDVVDALRANGDGKTIAVPGYQSSNVRGWASVHPDGWISDPAGNFVYEAHHYFDRDHSGEYSFTYGEELAHTEQLAAKAEGSSATSRKADYADLVLQPGVLPDATSPVLVSK